MDTARQDTAGQDTAGQDTAGQDTAAARSAAVARLQRAAYAGLVDVSVDAAGRSVLTAVLTPPPDAAGPAAVPATVPAPARRGLSGAWSVLNTSVQDVVDDAVGEAAELAEAAWATTRRHWPARWDRHPAVRSGTDLTRGERAADRMRNGMGSWLFVLSFLGFMALWAAGNTVLLGHTLHRHAFDPYPYILLNLFLSMLAGLQGAILLIAAKRSDQVASELATHDYATNVKTLERLESLHQHVDVLLQVLAGASDESQALLGSLVGTRVPQPQAPQPAAPQPGSPEATAPPDR